MNVGSDIDEVSIQVPKMTLAEITSEYDKYASALRKIDASIQKANWEFDVDFTDGENPFEKNN